MRESYEVHVFTETLFRIGKEKNLLDSLNEELRAFVELLRENSDIYSLLKSPRLTKKQKKKLLQSLASVFSKDFLAFVWVVLLKRGQKFYPLIQKAFQELYDQDRGIIRAKVSVAKELTSDLLDRIKKQIEELYPKKTILLTQELRPSILGGMILEMEDFRMDFSIMQHLHGLEKRLKQSPIEGVLE